MRNLLSILLLMTISFSAISQESIGVGEWRGHFPYNSLISVTSDDKGIIYAASKFSFFSYNTSTGLIDVYSKINYLSDIGIKCIKYNTDYDILFIAYSNSNIDLLRDNKIYNMNDIYRSNIIGYKTINNVYFKDKYAYLSCGFGIVVIDLVKEEVSERYFIGEEGTYKNVNDFSYVPSISSYVAATDHGLYAANDTSNLANFANWHKIEDVFNNSSKFNSIEMFNDYFIANVSSEEYDNDTTLVFDGQKWFYLNEAKSNNDVNDITTDGNYLIMSHPYGVQVFNTDLSESGRYWQYNSNARPHANSAIKVGDICWVADNTNGLAKCVNEWSAELIIPTGPEVAQAFKVVKNDKDMYALPGGYNISWVPMYNKAKYSVFSSNTWSTVSSKDIPKLDSISDIVDVAVDPRNPNRIFLASYFYGVIELIDGKVANIYNGSNSPLRAPEGYPVENVRCGGVVFDKNNNLWVSHSLGNGILNVLQSDNKWANNDNGGLFSSVNNKEVSSISIDTYGSKWLKTREYASIYVVNDNGTPADPSDDKSKKLTNSIGNGALSGQISAITVDNDGEVWIGSDLGISVIYYPQRVFDGGNFDAQEVLIEYNGTVRPLLESESVTCIAVDYGNNKWIGTATSGVYYLSPDGTKQFQHYTKENSFLLSNDIISISIDHMGEVFFSTSNGICSLKSESSEPEEDNDKIYAYPNPVRPDFTGKISVVGLIEDAHVKITDFAGNIVFSDKSNGGMITWDGYLPNGKRASSGVYVVFATDAQGGERAVTKILFIK